MTSPYLNRPIRSLAQAQVDRHLSEQARRDAIANRAFTHWGGDLSMQECLDLAKEEIEQC